MNALKATDYRSVESSDGFWVCFVNLSGKEVDILWLDYSGVEVNYKTIKNKHYFKISTYLTHPWIFRDSQSKHRLCFHFKPNPSPQEIRSNLVFVANDMPERGSQVVYIFDPIYSLKENCFQFMFKTIDRNQDFNELETALEIPKSVLNEYQNYIHVFYRTFN